MNVNDERGAVAITVGLLMIIFLGFAAIVIDVGALYQERRELQNGADSAALSVAKDCALGDCGDSGTTAEDLSDANAGDDLSFVEGVTIDEAAQTAKVDTRTEDADGGTRILHWFAPFLGRDGSTVRASATAEWAAVHSGPTVPLTIGVCDWENAGGTFPETGDPTIPQGTVGLTFHDGNTQYADTEMECNSTSGADAPGGFGWLNTENATCEAVVTVDADAPSDPGANPPKDCDPDDFLGQEVQIPVFESVSGTGKNTVFRVKGFATVTIKAMRLLMGNGSWTGETEPGLLAAHCPADNGGTGADQACIVVEFGPGFMPAGTPGTPGSTPNFGTVAVRLIA